MIRSFHLPPAEEGGEPPEVVATIPTTTREVLEFRIHIRSLLERDEAVYMVAVRQWLARFVRGADVAELTPVQAHYLAEVLCNEAGLPPARLADLRRALRRRDGIPEDFAGKPWCDCPYCVQAKAEGRHRADLVDVADPSVCKWYGVDTETERLICFAADCRDLDAPPWAAQVVRELDRAQSDGDAYRQEQKKQKGEDVQHTVDIWDKKFGGQHWRRPN